MVIILLQNSTFLHIRNGALSYGAWSTLHEVQAALCMRCKQAKEAQQAQQAQQLHAMVTLLTQQQGVSSIGPHFFFSLPPALSGIDGPAPFGQAPTGLALTGLAFSGLASDGQALTGLALTGHTFH
jgi:hypothetical protein